MRHWAPASKIIFVAVLFALSAGSARISHANPAQYPQFAQQSLPQGIVPLLVNVEELVDAIQAGAKPLIFDVRTEEEFQEAHILSAQSAPLAHFKDLMKNIPRDRLVVLY